MCIRSERESARCSALYILSRVARRQSLRFYGSFAPSYFGYLIYILLFTRATTPLARSLFSRDFLHVLLRAGSSLSCLFFPGRERERERERESPAPRCLSDTKSS